MSAGVAAPLLERPASFLQERMETLALGGFDADVCLCAWRLRGPLELARWQSAMAALGRRHEPLRSRLVRDADGALTQQVDPRPLVAVFAEERDGGPLGPLLERRLRPLARPFALAREPLVRSELVRLADDDHLTLWAISHALVDAFACALLIDELSAGVRRSGGLPPLPLTFGEVALRERAAVRSGRHARWARRLAAARRATAEEDDGRPFRERQRWLPPFPAPRLRRLAQIAEAGGWSNSVVWLAVLCEALRRARRVSRRRRPVRRQSRPARARAARRLSGERLAGAV